MRIERWWFTLPLRLKSLFRRARVESELDEELAFHLERKIEEGLAAGLAPDEARRAALRSMGGLEQRKEEIRDARRIHWWTDFADDLRYAARSLRRTPGLSLFVIFTLAVGIGMTATPFSMLDALVFRPYPVPRPGEVVTLVSTTHDEAYGAFSYREYVELRDGARSYRGMIANTAMSIVGFSPAPGVTPRARGGMMVSGNYFTLLGVEAQVGRTFRADEDTVPGRDRVAVLSATLWNNEFARDPAVVGRTIRLNGLDFTVIGVAPDSFPGMQIFARPDVYTPLAMAQGFSADPRKRFFEDRDDRQLTVRARLADGVSLAAAREELALLAKNFARHDATLYRDRGAAVRTFFEMRTRGDDVNWKFSIVFTILALSVMLVACTNVAGLLLSRGRTRAREVAVRLALGASRFRLVRLLLTESLLLAVCGGVLGLGVGYAGIRMFRAFQVPTELPTTIPFRMDLRVLGMSLVLCLAAALFFGLAPALQGSRPDLVTGLKSSDAEPPGRKRLWGRNLLVVAQVAVSLMLLTASFLMARSFRQTVVGGEGITPDRDRVLMARFDPRLAQYDAARTERFYAALAEETRQLPGVLAAGLTRNPPLGMSSFDTLAFVPEGFEMPQDRENFTAAMDVIDDGFFDALGVAVLHGRGFRTSDTPERPRVAVVNEQFARHYWPDDSPATAVGKRLHLDRATGEAVEIVGVTRTLKYREPAERPTDFVYLPLTQNPRERMVLLLRTDGDALRWVAPLQDLVRRLDANLPLLEMRTYDDLYRYHAVEGPGVAIRLVSTMGGIGLLLAVAGLYGLVAYNVSRRTREIGIRMAIGAGPVSVLRLVMGKGLTLVACGTGLGLLLGFGIERLLNATLFHAGGIDFVAYLVVVPSMVLATLLATYVPARRAAKIAPTLALRYE
jgi:macrolide transport system ATP-binding/permease protein